MMEEEGGPRFHSLAQAYHFGRNYRSHRADLNVDEDGLRLRTRFMGVTGAVLLTAPGPAIQICEVDVRRLAADLVVDIDAEPTCKCSRNRFHPTRWRISPFRPAKPRAEDLGLLVSPLDGFARLVGVVRDDKALIQQFHDALVAAGARPE